MRHISEVLMPVVKPSGRARKPIPPGADLSKEPSEATLSKVADGLLHRAAKGPQPPTRLSPQQQQEIRDRFKIGERADTIADYYHTDIATVRAVAAR